MTPLNAVGPFEALGRLSDADALAGETQVIDWVAQLHETMRVMESVCTGALILGAAGMLKSLRAVIHWWVMDALVGYVAKPVTEMVVWGGKVVA